MIPARRLSIEFCRHHPGKRAGHNVLVKEKYPDVIKKTITNSNLILILSVVIVTTGFNLYISYYIHMMQVYCVCTYYVCVYVYLFISICVCV